MNDTTNEDFCPFCGIDLRETPEHVIGDCRDATVREELALLKACAHDATHRQLYLQELRLDSAKRNQVMKLLGGDRAALGEYLAHLTGDDAGAWARMIALF